MEYWTDTNKPDGVQGNPLRWWGWSTGPVRRGWEIWAYLIWSRDGSGWMDLTEVPRAHGEITEMTWDGGM